ncbi:MAG: putative porin [Gammaproteobacteria bacterium]|nr:putative porin [Gammaproteobacteria bacterium]
MRKTALATAIAAALTLGAADASAQTKGAVTKAEVQSIQAQMQALVERMNRLEAANAELKSQNTELQELADRREAEMDYLKAQTKELREEGAVASNEISKVKGSDWAARIKGRGDFRFRNENIWTERVVGGEAVDAADRERMRIRARLGFDFKATDNVTGTLLFATGGDDPRSSNQTLGGAGSRKTIGLDMAFVDWKFMQGGDLLLGKMANPVFRPGQSLFYDGDFNPEGGAVKFDRGLFFGSAYGWWFSEGYNADPDSAANHDTTIIGLQGGLKFPLLGGETVLAANYYQCNMCKDNSPLFANNANGNTTYRVGTSPTNLLQYDYDIAELSAQMGTTVRNLPLTFWANYAQNMADDVEYDTAYAVGAMLGKAGNPKTWEAGLFYQSIDKDALFGQWVDSDFGDGRTDSEGWVLKGAYAPVRNFTIAGTYFMNTLNKDVGTELDYDRLQLDLNYKF